jgi:hypothetical protein
MRKKVVIRKGEYSMRYTHNLRTVVRSLQLAAITNLSVIMFTIACPVAAQMQVPVAPFRSIELHDGARVILRHGPTQSVTLLKGSTDCAQFTMAAGGKLVIDKYNSQCSRKYELEIEIITPYIAEILVMDGGSIQANGSFPRQAEIKTAVRNGGVIDIRRMVTDRVNASVEQGGQILVTPLISLSAGIVNGGQIMYWGDARIESSVRLGGAITRGSATEADKPLSEFKHP